MAITITSNAAGTVSAERLANDPTARFPDEEDDDDEKNDIISRKMMEYLENCQEDLGSQHYVALANICGEMSTVERRNGRMKRKLLEYDGSDCSALMPSDDEEFTPDNFNSDDDDEASDNESEESDVHMALSVCSTAISDAVEEINDATASRKAAALSPSGYFMKYQDVYFMVPKPAILRTYKRTIAVPTHSTFEALTSRGSRARAWTFEPICPAAVVVVEMKTRLPNSQFEKDFFWCVSLKLNETNDNDTDDAKILHVLPETTVARLYQTLLVDPQLASSSLVQKYAPKWLKMQTRPPATRQIPIPGNSKSMPQSPDPRIPRRVLTGNYWPKLSSKKRLRSALDRGTEESDSE